jgi:hypothetical protein
MTSEQFIDGRLAYMYRASVDSEEVRVVAVDGGTGGHAPILPETRLTVNVSEVERGRRSVPLALHLSLRRKEDF